MYSREQDREKSQSCWNICSNKGGRQLNENVSCIAYGNGKRAKKNILGKRGGGHMGSQWAQGHEYEEE